MFKFMRLSVLAAIGIIFLLSGLALGAGKNGNPSKGTLSEAEITDLRHLREEEKLARDVYRYFYDIYQKAVFSNIASAEQQHMDAVKTLLDRYGIADPVAGLGPGVFADPDFQQLYDDLTAAGTPAEGEQLLDALQRALHVGATIEDMDIYDIQFMVLNTSRDDLINVYQNLMKGSRNHLRSFAGLLESLYGVDYVAQYLSQEDVDAIISSPKETGSF